MTDNPYAVAANDERPSIVFQGREYVDAATHDRVMKAYDWNIQNRLAQASGTRSSEAAPPHGGLACEAAAPLDEIRFGDGIIPEGAAADYLDNVIDGRCADADSVHRMIVEARLALGTERRDLIARVARYRYALTEVDICLRWIADHYPKVIREMPTELHRRLESVRVDYDE